ncbi:hypothetical protein P775_00580 [Puniceibacterium antarcticum]|uniref:Uncharacterized protein n=1 Tax=Puniceibacterium antarcticum TaxID=1206336 RepID=A0A2G8RKR3_9RHOB|nr:hypothetical protein [Puniceibacterium antarcticum]PIL22174.1 hypothetical protein P775_00580 [Puniceibacterium antarcticum]
MEGFETPLEPFNVISEFLDRHLALNDPSSSTSTLAPPNAQTLALIIEDRIGQPVDVQVEDARIVICAVPKDPLAAQIASSQTGPDAAAPTLPTVPTAAPDMDDRMHDRRAGHAVISLDEFVAAEDIVAGHPLAAGAKRSGFDILPGGKLDMVGAGAKDVPPADLSFEQKADLARELADVAAALDRDFDEDEKDSAAMDAAVEHLAREGIRKSMRMGSPARALLTQHRIGEVGNSTALDRLMDETNSQMSEPEGNRRRSAIAHLRAAVAAARADRILDRKRDADKAAPYRADLANLGIPRDCEHSASLVVQRRNAHAPLTLVREQRVDLVPRDALATESSDEAFVDFVHTVGAQDLSERIEAAAAYLTFIEGCKQFSRPQLMTKLRAVETQNTTREDRLNSFGQLLRDGKIERMEGGRFTASTQSRFKPDKRAVG